jgi:hypothetical protein
MGEINSYKILVRKHEGKRSLGRPRLRQEDDIRMNLTEIGWEGLMDWSHLVQDRDQWWALEQSNEPLDSIKGRGCLN